MYGLHVLEIATAYTVFFCGILRLSLTGANDIATVPSPGYLGETLSMTCEWQPNDVRAWRVFWRRGPTDPVNELVYFYRDNDRDEASGGLAGRADGNMEPGKHTLTIRALEHGDALRYRCEVTVLNTDSPLISTPEQLAVHVRPTGVSISGKTTVEADIDVTYNCQVQQVKPQASIYWKKSGSSPVSPSQTPTGSPDGDGVWTISGQFTTSFNKTEDKQKVQCLVTEKDTSANVRHTEETASITVQYRPSTRVVEHSPGPKPIQGQRHTLRCDIIESQPPTITSVAWRRGGASINGGRYDFDNSARTLAIKQLDHNQDDGNYTCSATNSVGEGPPGQAFRLEIFHPPQVGITQPNPVVEGYQTTIPCSRQGGRPATLTAVQWTKGGSLITVDGSHYAGATLSNPSLIINIRDKNDAGSYVCGLQNEVGSTLSTAVSLVVYYAPLGAPALSVSKPTVAVEEATTFTCDVTSVEVLPQITHYSWGKQSDSSFNINGTSNTWTHTSVSVKDTGKFACTPSNLVGTGKASNMVDLTVQAPAYIEEPTSSQVHSPRYNNTDFKLSCTASGNQVTIAWFKVGGNLGSDWQNQKDSHPSGAYQYDQTSARKSELQWNAPAESTTCDNIRRHNGEYKCTASATAGGTGSSVDATHSLNVQYPSIWAGDHPSNATEAGQTNILLHCTVCASPAPSAYKWTLVNGTELRPEISGRTTPVITIPAVQGGDFGLYICRVTNNYDGQPTHQEFTVELLEKGRARKPDNVRVLENRTSIALTVAWTPGSAAGFPPLTFHLKYREVGAADFTLVDASIPESGTSRDVFVTVMNLKPEKDYEFTVKARNKRPVEEGPNDSNFTYVQERTRGSPSAEVQNVEMSESSLEVTWMYTEGSRRKRSISDYSIHVQVQYRQKDHPQWTIHPADGSRIPAEQRNVTIADTFDLTKAYTVQLLLFEGDLLTSSGAAIKDIPAVSGGPPVAIIAGAVSAGVLVLIVIIISVLLMRRRSFAKKSGDEHLRLNHTKGAQMRNGGITDEEMDPNAETTGLATQAAGTANGGASFSGDPSALYAQPDKLRKTGPQAAGGTAANQDLYAQVDKRNQNAARPGGKPPVPTKPTGPEGPYAKVAIQGATGGYDENPYQNFAEQQQGDMGENPYMNVDEATGGDADGPQQLVGPDGILYADLTFKQQQAKKKKVPTATLR